MLYLTRRIALVAAGTTAMLALAAAPALADAGDTLTPANTSFNVTNSGNVTISGKVNGISFTVTCTSVSLTAKTPASGSPSLTASVTSSPPASFSGCTDTAGGTDTVTTSGTWSLTNTDAGDPSTEPNSGDQLTINIPNNGASFTSTALPGCTIKVSPASTPTSSSFDDKTTATYTNASLNVTGSGFFCSPSSPAKLSGTFKSSITVSDTA